MPAADLGLYVRKDCNSYTSEIACQHFGNSDDESFSLALNQGTTVFIFVDGTVKYGHDVLKYVALGADAVMVGRHIVRGAHGGGSRRAR